MPEFHPTIRDAFRITWKQRRSLISLLAGINVLAVLIFIPVFTITAKELTHSLYSDQLFRQLQIPWLIELFLNHRDLFVITPVQGVLLSVFIIFGWWFSSGAFIGVIYEDKCSFRDFLNAGIQNLIPMLKVSLFGLIPLIVFVVVASILKAPISAIAKHSLSFTPILILNLFRIFLLILLYLILRMWLDTTRAYVIARPGSSTWKALWSAGRVIRLRFRDVVRGYYGIALIGALALAVYLFFSYYWPLHSMVSVLLLFLLQQIYLFIRLILRFASLAYMSGYVPPLEEQILFETPLRSTEGGESLSPYIPETPPSGETPSMNDLT